MQLNCGQQHLAKGLALVSRAVGTRPTLPVLGNILLEANAGQLRLTATNRRITISCWIGARVVDEGEFTVPARLLNNLVSKLPTESVELTLVVRTHTLHLRCGSYDVMLKGIDAYEFPITPTLATSQQEAGLHLQLNLGKLRTVLDQVIFAAADDELRPTLTGVELRFADDGLTLAATDGYRLSVARIELMHVTDHEPFTIIIPAESLAEVARVSTEAEEKQPIHLVITQTRNQVLFRLPGKETVGKGAVQAVELVSELMNATYPDYAPAIPQTCDTKTVVDKTPLLQAVQVAALFARGGTNGITVVLSPSEDSQSGKLRLTVASAELGTYVNEINATISGTALEIILDYRFLLDILSRIAQPQVLIETTLPTRPCVIRPVGMQADAFRHVIWPMHRPE